MTNEITFETLLRVRPVKRTAWEGANLKTRSDLDGEPAEDMTHTVLRRRFAPQQGEFGDLLGAAEDLLDELNRDLEANGFGYIEVATDNGDPSGRGFVTTRYHVAVVVPRAPHEVGQEIAPEPARDPVIEATLSTPFAQERGDLRPLGDVEIAATLQGFGDTTAVREASGWRGTFGAWLRYNWRRLGLAGTSDVIARLRAGEGLDVWNVRPGAQECRLWSLRAVGLIRDTTPLVLLRRNSNPQPSPIRLSLADWRAQVDLDPLDGSGLGPNEILNIIECLRLVGRAVYWDAGGTYDLRVAA